jgi:tetratricopeptide (TPR) repeat protein
MASGSIASPRLSPIAVMGLVFAAALAVRLLYLAAYRHSPFFAHLLVDAQWHDEWARRWAAGDWDMGGKAFFRAPLYPLWLSGIYRVFGPDPLAARVVQMVLGAAAAALLAGAGIRWGGRAAGIAAGGLAAVYGPLVFFDGELLITNLLLALLAGTLYAASGGASLGAAAVSGGLLGLAVTARPNALALLPAVAYWVWRKHGDEGARRWRRVGMVCALAVTPALGVTAINAAVEGTWVFVAGQGGVNFYAGNHPRASGRSVEIPELSGILTWRQFVEESEAAAERGAGRELNSREVSGWWFRRGLDWIRSEPGAALSLTARKLYYLVNAAEIPNNRDLYFERPGILRALLFKTGFFAFPWGLVFPLAGAGLVLALRDPARRDGARALALWFALYALSLLPFFITARFRMGLLPPVLLLAGLALAHPRRAMGFRPAAVFAVLLVLVNTTLAGVRTENPALELSRLGDVYLRQNRNAEALPVLERARGMAPGDPVIAHLLAEACLRAGRAPDAIPLYLQVVDARPGDPDARFNLGVAYLHGQRFEDAANAFTTVVRMRPDHIAGWVNLGFAFEGRGMPEAAEEVYRKGVALGPAEALPVLRLAGLLIDQERFEEAAEILTPAGARITDSYELLYTLAIVNGRLERWGEARDALERALRLNPDDSQARRLMDWLATRP